MTMHSTVR